MVLLVCYENIVNYLCPSIVVLGFLMQCVDHLLLVVLFCLLKVCLIGDVPHLIFADHGQISDIIYIGNEFRRLDVWYANTNSYELKWTIGLKNERYEIEMQSV